MAFASFVVPDFGSAGRVIAAAVHDGHGLRRELTDLVKLDDETRLREEDPYTGAVASRFNSNIVVHRSRFEVDLNREREMAVYHTPDDAWGLEVWREPLPEEETVKSLGLYDRFYDELASTLDQLVDRRGGFVLYDIHSYNHRRAGPEADADSPLDSPTVNLGTGSLPGRWRSVADVFAGTMASATLNGVPLDVGENVRFEGRQVARWVHENYGNVGCALAIELKKVFMDEWSGEVYPDSLTELGDALLASVEDVERAWVDR